MADDLIIDLTNYKDRVGSRVVPGRYTVIVEDAESDTARSGNPMVNLWYRIQGGEFDGATIVDRLVLTEKSMFRVVGFMQAIGLQTPRKRLKINIRQFKGRRLEIDVADGEPYQGRVKSEVRGYMRVAKDEAEGPADLDEFEGVDSTDEGPVEPDAPVTSGAAVDNDVEPEETPNIGVAPVENDKTEDAGDVDDEDVVDVSEIDVENIDL